MVTMSGVRHGSNVLPVPALHWLWRVYAMETVYYWHWLYISFERCTAWRQHIAGIGFTVTMSAWCMVRKQHIVGIGSTVAMSAQYGNNEIWVLTLSQPWVMYGMGAVYCGYQLYRRHGWCMGAAYCRYWLNGSHEWCTVWKQRFAGISSMVAMSGVGHGNSVLSVIGIKRGYRKSGQIQKLWAFIRLQAADHFNIKVTSHQNRVFQYKD